MVKITHLIKKNVEIWYNLKRSKNLWKDDVMNIALVIAGGVGSRMRQDIPKQFLSVNDKPVIIYTLECFQKHPAIDAIAVVCLEGWEDVLRVYCKQFNITKLKWIVKGGENGQSSIRNGIFKLREECNENDIILIHDAIRPMLSDEIISNNIATCKQKGNAITYIPCAEAMLESDNKEFAISQIDRSTLVRTQTPQTFYLKDIASLHEEALEKEITNSVASCTLMLELEKKVYLTLGSEKNLKLTTPDDLEIFKALLSVKRDEWIK